MEEENYCFYSSFLFLLSAIISTFYRQYIFTFLLLALFLVSTSFHYHKTFLTETLDKTVVWIFILYSVYFYLRKGLYEKQKVWYGKQIGFLYIVIGVWFYAGHAMNAFCYDPNPMIAQLYHCALHGIVSLNQYLMLL